MQNQPQNSSFSKSAFGSAIAARAYASGEYRYGFNGMEKDSENNSGAYDFGERVHDTRLGRFLSIDPFADKNVSVSPFAFADNNPIIFIDAYGCFRMSPRQQRKYPQLTNMLKNIQTTVHNDPATWAAFKETLGLTDDEANAILEWGKGPKVRVGRTLGDYGRTKIKNGNITLNKKMIKQLEGKMKRNSKVNSEGLVFLVYITVLHEGQHTAEVYYKKSLLPPGGKYDSEDKNTEAGLVFEQKAVGVVVDLSNANEVEQENNKNRVVPNVSPSNNGLNIPNDLPTIMGSEEPEEPVEESKPDKRLSRSLGVDTNVQQ